MRTGVLCAQGDQEPNVFKDYVPDRLSTLPSYAVVVLVVVVALAAVVSVAFG